jgi:hypothetical protein
MRTFDLTGLRGRKLFVGTPMYDGRCTATYAFSIARLTALCTQLGIDLRYYFLSYEALVTKARNITTDEFMRSGYQHLVFIDADIGFDAGDVLHMLAMQVLDAQAAVYDVVAAPYPLKRIAWEKVLKAAKAGVADADPTVLARHSSGVAVHPVRAGSFPVDAPVEVTKAGTGMMMIRRETFERLANRDPSRKCAPSGGGMAASADADICAFFETEVDSKQGHIAEEIREYLTRHQHATPADILAFLDSDETMGSYDGAHVSEDYAFCRRVRAAGMKVWLCPWMELNHTGDHIFTSRLADLGAIGAL